MKDQISDIFIIGGGINGIGIANDAAGRGLSVTLSEANDLASATSSASSKLIHGGLRYLEHYEFRLVREALKEREILLKKAPHLIHPLSFVMPHNQLLRPAWMLRLGLFLYDHLSHRHSLAKSRIINLQRHVAGTVLHPNYTKGFIYSDCWVDDARLVVVNAIQARRLGAKILTQTQCVSAKRDQGLWQITVVEAETGKKAHLQAKILINAAGPWVEEVLTNKIGVSSKHHISLVKGSHIVVPRIHSDNFAYILQNEDKRVIFVIPFLEHYSLIGTTDVAFTHDPHYVKISKEEIDYLCRAINHYFKKSISANDIIWSYAGVRPLHNDHTAQNLPAISRDYILDLNVEHNIPLLSVFGGKITTYRKLAEHALEKLKAFLPKNQNTWTANSPLPGADFAEADFSSFCQAFKKRFPWLPSSLAQRYTHIYGNLALEFLHDCQSIEDLGQHFGFGLYQHELDYLIQQEWVKKAEDVLWRRTKLGLLISYSKKTEMQTVLNDYIQLKKSNAVTYL